MFHRIWQATVRKLYKLWKKASIVILSEAKNLSWAQAKNSERFFASLRMTRK
jgi:hypothetical protein